MPKSASSTIQLGFLAKIPDINYASHEFIEDSPMHQAVLEIARSTNFAYQADKMKEIFAARDTKLPTVISSELFLWNGIAPDVFSYQDKEVVADRLYELFPDAQILLIIRNPFDILKSLYAQLYSAVDFSLTNFSFKKWVDINIEQDKLNLNSFFSLLRYDEILEVYSSRFKQVKVLMFEEIKHDFEAFISNDLCPYVGLDAQYGKQYFENKVFNQRHYKSEMFLIRMMNGSARLFRKFLGNPQRLISLEKRQKFGLFLRHKFSFTKFGKIETNFTAEQKQILTEKLSAGNRKIEEMYKVNLAQYNYPV